MKKFELTNEKIIKFGRTLYRIKALISFGTVRAGDLGGYVEKEENLSQSGNAWVSGNAQVSGNAEITKSTHYLTIGLIGSRNDTTTFFRTKYKEINVKCGCFLGSILDFRLKVKETHASNKHEKVYELACQLAEAQIDLSDNVSI